MFNILSHQIMQMKTNLRFYLTSVRMAKIKNNDDNLCFRDWGVKGTLLHCWWEFKLVWPLWMSVWRFLRKLGNNLPQDPVIPLLGIYPKDAQSYHKDMCSTMFIAAFFVIDRTWKQRKCPLIKERIRKIGTFTQWRSTQQKKINDILNFVEKLMELENILSEVTQTQKDNCHIYSLIGDF